MIISNTITFDFLMCVNVDNPFLDASIESMLNQDYDKNYNIIIVANNCNDELYQKLRDYERKYENIILYRTLIGQLAFNLNYGANLSSADYLIRMDSDDVCLKNRLKLTEKYIYEFDYPDVIVGGYKYINDKNECIGDYSRIYDSISLKKILPFKNIIRHPACAIKLKSFFSIKGYAGSLHGEDYDLWTRMLRNNYTFKSFKEPIIYYRLSNFQVRGSAIAYADGIGVRLREFILGNNWLYLLGFFYSLFKFLVLRLVNRVKF
ncbi:glycosyltransferase family 2 protein [Providencia alcalifaciens]|uniref:glycosyltransferase n=1 Tax=Providencia alcalifaciens TaxID=126385 RepID=UPI00259E6482